MRTVKNILKAKTVVFNTVEPSTLVIDALSLLNSLNLSYLVVMQNNNYKGIFSERDYSRNVILKGRHSNEVSVSDVMTTDIPVVRLTDTAEYCLNLIHTYKTRYLLAYDADEKFVGVITINDLLRQVMNDKEDVFSSKLERRAEDDDHGIY